MPGLPLVGSMPELLLDPLTFFLKCYMTLGPVFRVTAPTRSYIVMAGVEATRFLLREDARLFDHTPLYQGVARELNASHYPISTSGARHQHLRQSLQPAFSTAPLGQGTPSIAAAIEAHLTATAPEQERVALPWMHALLGDLVLPALAGRALGSHLSAAVRFARFSVGTGLGAYPELFRFSPPYLLSKWRMQRFFRALIAQHHASPPGADRSPDFFDQVMSLTDEDDAPLSADNVVAIAQMIYSNTLLYVAPAAAFLLYDLLANPAALARCREELDAAFADGPPTLAQLEACTWFSACRRESMRMNPIGLAAPRVVTESFTFGGCRIEAGEALLVAVTAAHYLPEIYPEPHRFDPARHLAPRHESQPLGAYAPLGLGAHVCMGRRLVDAMLTVLIGTLLHHGDLELPPTARTLHKRVNPFPEPTDALTIRIKGLRT